MEVEARTLTSGLRPALGKVPRNLRPTAAASGSQQMGPALVSAVSHGATGRERGAEVPGPDGPCTDAEL